MNNKGNEAEITIDETESYSVIEERPLKSSYNQSKKVDINVLKARVQETQNRQNKKNVTIFVSLLTALGALGIYLSV